MALTVSVVDTFHAGDKQINIVDITGDSSYPTGGEALTAATLGFDQQVDAQLGAIVARKTSATVDSESIIFSYNSTTAKLVAYWGNAGSASVIPEVTDTTNIAAFTGRGVFIGQ